MCLYAHTRYRTREGLTNLFEKFDLARQPHLIVVADRLQALDRLVTGRYWTVDGTYRKSRSEADQLKRLVERVAAKCGAADKGQVVFWETISHSKEFSDLTARLWEILTIDPELQAQSMRFVEGRVERFGMKKDDKEREWQTEYLLGEMAMSIYCTEVLGYANEVWERPLGPDEPDPIGAAYAHQSDSLLALLHKDALERHLHFLYER